MVVGPINQSDPSRGIMKVLAKRQSAKASAQDDHMRSFTLCHGAYSSANDPTRQASREFSILNFQFSMGVVTGILRFTRFSALNMLRLGEAAVLRSTAY